MSSVADVRQLEFRLQLAFEALNQLNGQDTIEREFVRVGTESYGLNLPEGVRPESIPQHPSEFMLPVIQDAVQSTVSERQTEFLEEFRKVYNEKADALEAYNGSRDHDLNYPRTAAELRVARLYLDRLNLDLVKENTNPLVQKEWCLIVQRVQAWAVWGELAVEILSEESSLYRDLDKALVMFQQALAKGFNFDRRHEVVACVQSLMNFNHQVEVLKGADPTRELTPEFLVEQVIILSESLVYKPFLPHCSVERLEESLEYSPILMRRLDCLSQALVFVETLQMFEKVRNDTLKLGEWVGKQFALLHSLTA